MSATNIYKKNKCQIFFLGGHKLENFIYLHAEIKFLVPITIKIKTNVTIMNK
jgi:hypothetical protein